MKLYRDMEVAQTLYATPIVQEAMMLACSGEAEQACWKIDKFLATEPDPEIAIFALRETVSWKSDLGRIEEAAEDAQDCARQARALWGDLDERTLIMRGTELYRLGKAGLIKQAVSLADGLLVDARRGLDQDDELLSAIRNNSARIYESAGDCDAAKKMYSDLLSDFDEWEQAHTDAALSTRDNYAQFLREEGQFEECLAVLRRQILLLTELIGVSSVDTLAVRHEAAVVTLMTGDTQGAIEQWESLAADCRQFLESSHPLTCEVLSSLLTSALEQNNAKAIMKWSDHLITAYREVDEPQILASLVRLRNQYRELNTDNIEK